MGLGDWVRLWTGAGYRHIPQDSPRDVLDLTYSLKAKDNRWNEQGEPTLYFAKDHGVVAAEWARHLKVKRTAKLAQIFKPRAVYRCRIAAVRLIDLCDSAVWNDLGLDDLPYRFTDIRLARALAHLARYSTDAEGLIVPSMAFLDDLSRWDVVLFHEKVQDRKFVTSKRVVGTLTYETIRPYLTASAAEQAYPAP